MRLSGVICIRCAAVLQAIWLPSRELFEVHAGGFPSPAADYYESPISLDDLMEIRAPHVYLVRMEGESMRDVGILDGIRLVVDRAIKPYTGHTVLAYVDNQPAVKRLAQTQASLVIESANPEYGRNN